MKWKSLSNSSKIKITKAGWFYIVITILLGVAGVNTGNNLIYLTVSAMLAFMGISGFLSRINLSGIDVSLIPPREIFATTPAVFKLTVKNKKRFFSSFLITVKVEDKYITFPYINKKEEIKKEVALTFQERGIKKVKSVKLCSVFPFNFFERCNLVDIDVNFIVFPRPIKGNLPFSEGKRLAFTLKHISNKKGTEGEFGGISEYKAGTPLKLISWKASAKAGKLMIKDLYLDENSGYIMDLEKIKAPVERKVSIATYLILFFYKRNIPVGLKTKDKLIKPTLSTQKKLEMLKELALYA